MKLILLVDKDELVNVDYDFEDSMKIKYNN